MFQISEDLYERLNNAPLEIKLHSCFRSAVNFKAGDQLLTFLSAGKCLQPLSIRFDKRMDFQKAFFPDEMMRLTKEGLFAGIRQIYSFPGIKPTRLELDSTPDLTKAHADLIGEFLAARTNGGISELIAGKSDNVYTKFLAPRIEAFRNAVREGDIGRISAAVERIAGCGPGLTPSSDDFLCGYVAVFPGTEKYDRMRKRIIDIAVTKTNDISASLLVHAKNNRFSEDIIRLFAKLETEEKDEIREALTQVADFGSSSGCDLLTGMYFGILDVR